jgi:xanthine/CO dehydrogenase XdhC/CoxF family maturation factor
MDYGHDRGSIDPACAIAHGDQPAEDAERSLVAVFASPVAEYLLHFARETGYRTILVDPEPTLVTDRWRHGPHLVAESADRTVVDTATDVVITDHDRPELGAVLAQVLGLPSRWIGIVGNSRHEGPHVAALRALGVADDQIARVHRPIGLNIGSKAPAEIAVATLAGLIADRNGRPGGFVFPVPAVVG